MGAAECVQIGPCQLWLGDCREVLALLPSGEADAVVTSPPYNCGKDYGTAGDDLPMAAYWEWLEGVLTAAAGLLKPHGHLCVNHANYIGSREERVAVADELRPILDRLLPPIDCIIWDKGPPNGAAWGNYPTSPRLRAQHENIFVHGCGGMPPSDIEWPEWSRFTTSIWRVPTTGVDASIHPAMMPVQVAYRLVRLYTPAGGLVVDPFMGSGTTGVACLKAGRRFIGIEIDPGHFSTACRRIQAAWDAERSSLFPAFSD